MRRLLFTGASGFLGNSIKPLLSREYDVKTVGLTDEDDFKVNLVEGIPTFDGQYDVVLHAAGKAHSVPATPAEAQVFYDVNYQGTVNLCSALERCGVPKAFIFISTVAVYGCEEGEEITEDHPLNGKTPYARSKILAEEYLIDWAKKHNVVLSILRPSLLAGKNAPGNLGDLVNRISKGFYFDIAGGKAKKSVMMVEDIARLLPLLIERGGIYNVCDSHHPSFGELSALISQQLGKRKPLSIPYWIAWLAAKCGDLLGKRFPLNSKKLAKITNSLTFSNAKARRELNWEPLDVLGNYKV